MNKLRQYIWNILISIDQFGNTITGGAPDETISSRLGRNYQGSWIERLVDWGAYVLTGKKNHCEDALEPESHQEGAIIAKADDDKRDQSTLLS
jgi:hypothetical protein